MDHQLLTAVMSGQPLTVEQQAKVSAALETHDQVEAIRGKVAAIDWASILGSLLPIILNFIPAPIRGIIDLLIKLFNIKIPTNGGGGTVPVVPVNWP